MKKAMILIVMLILTGCETSQDIYMNNVNGFMKHIRLAEANDCTMNLYGFYTHNPYMTFNCGDEVLTPHELIKKFK